MNLLRALVCCSLAASFSAIAALAVVDVSFSNIITGIKTTSMEIKSIQDLIVQQEKLRNEIKQAGTLKDRLNGTLDDLASGSIRDQKDLRALLVASKDVAQLLGEKDQYLTRAARIASREGKTLDEMVKDNIKQSQAGQRNATERVKAIQKLNTELDGAMTRRADLATRMKNEESLNAILQQNGEALIEISKQLHNSLVMQANLSQDAAQNQGVAGAKREEDSNKAAARAERIARARVKMDEYLKSK